MGYDISYHNENGEQFPAGKYEDASTYVSLGDRTTEMGVTFNYSKIYRRFNFHITDLHGLYGKDVMWQLNRIVKALGTERTEDPWEATDGNAGFALSVLLAWTKDHPEGFFSVVN